MSSLPATGSRVNRSPNPVISGLARAMITLTRSSVNDAAWSASLHQTSGTQMASGSSDIVFTIHTHLATKQAADLVAGLQKDIEQLVPLP